jgi:hypothetical protein
MCEAAVQSELSIAMETAHVMQQAMHLERCVTGQVQQLSRTKVCKSQHIT